MSASIVDARARTSYGCILRSRMGGIQPPSGRRTRRERVMVIATPMSIIRGTNIPAIWTIVSKTRHTR
ncbi:hypothetical protein BDW75DRAFT_206233 [Aspergillus navahoensis]